jgi:RNA polymerase sigma-70 factor (ECF subfamily)
VRATDEELVRRLVAKEDAAYEALLREHGPWMLGLARRLLEDDGEAEDAVQDACLSAFRALPAFHGDARLSTWLHRIVVNAALMRLRRKRRRLEASIDAFLPAFRPDRTHESPVTDWRSDATDEIATEETRRAVRLAVRTLPSPYRAVVVLRDVEGLAMEEVATLLDLSLAGAKSRLHRARLMLRAHLAPLFEESTGVVRRAR